MSRSTLTSASSTIRVCFGRVVASEGARLPGGRVGWRGHDVLDLLTGRAIINSPSLHAAALRWLCESSHADAGPGCSEARRSAALLMTGYVNYFSRLRLCGVEAASTDRLTLRRCARWGKLDLVSDPDDVVPAWPGAHDVVDLAAKLPAGARRHSARHQISNLLGQAPSIQSTGAEARTLTAARAWPTALRGYPNSK